MRILFVFLLLVQSAFGVDFDTVVVGTSPFSLFEALARCESGERVLILDEASECGGAWKSIDICGVPHADMGCHQISTDLRLKIFLEKYAGCRMVSLDNPLLPYSPLKKDSGYYFSQGCFELIDHLLKRIEKSSITLLLDHKLDMISIDQARKIAHIETQGQTFTTSKIVVTHHCYVQVDGVANPQRPFRRHKHLYLLIQDPTPPRFAYKGGTRKSIRMMNLTHFTGLYETGRQLIVIEIQEEPFLADTELFLQELKLLNLVDCSAFLLRSDSYVYQTQYCNWHILERMGVKEYFEILNTGHISNLAKYIEKWEQNLRPYAEVVGL